MALIYSFLFKIPQIISFVSLVTSLEFPLYAILKRTVLITIRRPTKSVYALKGISSLLKNNNNGGYTYGLFFMTHYFICKKLRREKITWTPGFTETRSLTRFSVRSVSTELLTKSVYYLHMLHWIKIDWKPAKIQAKKKTKYFSVILILYIGDVLRRANISEWRVLLTDNLKFHLHLWNLNLI